VQYAAVPTVGFRSIKGILGLLLVVGTFVGVIFLPKQFFFPALMAYVLFGIGRTAFLGLLDRLPGREDEADHALLEDAESVSQRRRRRRRRSQRTDSDSGPSREDPTV
jgi:hypothetical protein